MAFEDTRWSLVHRAASDGDGAQEALASLCQTYWPPLYSFLRARGYPKEDASDLLQGFFLVLIEKNFIQIARPEAGRFRSFLLTALVRYVSNDSAKNRALKRGGGALHVRIDADEAELLHDRIPAAQRTPEEVFERQWALGILERALDELGQAYRKADKGALFEHLSPVLAGAAGGDADYQSIAEMLGMTPGAVRVAVHRLRQRYRQSIRRIVAGTVATEAQVDEELAHLIEILSRPAVREP